MIRTLAAVWTLLAAGHLAAFVFALFFVLGPAGERRPDGEPGLALALGYALLPSLVLVASAAAAALTLLTGRLAHVVTRIASASYVAGTGLLVAAIVHFVWFDPHLLALLPVQALPAFTWTASRRALRSRREKVSSKES